MIWLSRGRAVSAAATLVAGCLAVFMSRLTELINSFSRSPARPPFSQLVHHKFVLLLDLAILCKCPWMRTSGIAVPAR